jgi:hypothetical protein
LLQTLLSHLLYKDSEAGRTQFQELIESDLRNFKDGNLIDLNFEFLVQPRLKISPTTDEEIANQNADL